MRVPSKTNLPSLEYNNYVYQLVLWQGRQSPGGHFRNFELIDKNIVMKCNQCFGNSVRNIDIEFVSFQANDKFLINE